MVSDIEFDTIHNNEQLRTIIDIPNTKDKVNPLIYQGANTYIRIYAKRFKCRFVPIFM